MTVKALLEGMTQKEFCYWIAFHRIENEKDSPNKEGKSGQEQKDANMLSQLLALAGKKNPQKDENARA